MVKMIVAVLAAALLAVPAATAAGGERPPAAEPNIVQTAIAVNDSGTVRRTVRHAHLPRGEPQSVLNLLSQRGQYTVFAPTALRSNKSDVRATTGPRSLRT